VASPWPSESTAGTHARMPANGVACGRACFVAPIFGKYAFQPDEPELIIDPRANRCKDYAGRVEALRGPRLFFAPAGLAKPRPAPYQSGRYDGLWLPSRLIETAADASHASNFFKPPTESPQSFGDGEMVRSPLPRCFSNGSRLVVAGNSHRLLENRMLLSSKETSRSVCSRAVHPTGNRPLVTPAV